MLKEVMQYLLPQQGSKIVDCTFGGGGYTSAILEAVGETGEVIAFDRDKLAIENGLKKFRNNKNLKLINKQYSELKNVLDEELGEDVKVAGIVMDLGLSSAQLADESRGFSFQRAGDLKMEMSGADSRILTIDIVNRWRQVELEKIIREYGEERFARNIARKIVEYRREKKIQKVEQLVDIIANSVPGKYRRDSKIHFATRTFQALRIATNEELLDLENTLPQALDKLAVGGRLVIVSFHSLEDRIVKKFFRKENRECICPPEVPLCRCNHKVKLKIITKKPLVAGATEIANNPRSRSAKLRVAERQ